MRVTVVRETLAFRRSQPEGVPHAPDDDATSNVG